MRSTVRFLAALILAGSTLTGAGPAGAQSPSPSPTPGASASPFPVATVAPASEVPHGPKLVLSGQPDATKTRRGIRLELWQSSPTVAPGEWVRFAVRTTNVGKRSAWQMSGECLTSGTVMLADMRAVTPAGVTWTGNPAAFKERVTKGYQTEQFPPWRYLDHWWGTATAWAECGHGPGPLELRPGEARVEHFAWYAGDRLDDGDLWTPPYAGMVPVTVEWPFLARGARPRVGDHGRVRADPIRLQVPLTITGDGPGTPSLHELVDIALDDPAWRAWVETDPSRKAWSRYYVRAHDWAGPSYPGSFRNTFDHPNGIVELTLYQRLLRGADHVPAWILLDPWTGEVVHVQVPAPILDAPGSAPASPLPSPST